MRSGVVVVLNICPKDLIEVPFVEDGEVIQTFSPNRANHSFGKGILPGRPWRDKHLLEVHGFHPVNERFSVDLVTVSNHVLRRAVERKGFRNLPSCPDEVVPVVVGMGPAAR